MDKEKQMGLDTFAKFKEHVVWGVLCDFAL